MVARRTKKPCSSAAFFCRPGDGSWSPVECAEEIGQVSSITYCDGAFYLFDEETRRTVGVDCETFAVATVIEPPPVTLIVPDEHLLTWNRPKAESTLVVSSAEEFLVIVRTHQPEGSYGGSGEDVLIEAFRWDRRSWAGVDDIGDHAVFVDSFRGFCVEANGVNGLRRNCMYVASTNCLVDDECGMDVLYGVYSVSVLDLADLTTQNLSHGNLMNCRYGRHLQWPTWFMPNLH
jgi:hypothetical protein